MSRAKVDPKKEEQERLAVILQDLLKEEENKYCADCNAKTPRWASWNLGVFICITCAGIHRNLGVHISKVRSVNLDSWTPEQVQSMRVMGNEKAKRVYEHSLPATFRRPMAVHQLEQFIRAKYDQKRYILKDFVYPKIDASELPKPGAPVKNTVVIRDVGVPSLKSPPVTAKASSNSISTPGASNGLDLLDFSTPSKPTNTAKPAPGLDLFADDPFGATQPVASDTANDMDDMFGNFVTAAPVEQESSSNILVDNFASFPSTAATAAPEASNALSNDIMGLSLNEPSSSMSTATEEKKSNADILSLFSNSSNTAPPQLVAPGGFAAFGIQAAPSVAPAQPSLNLFDAPAPTATPAGGAASLLGLNFGGPPVQQQNPLSGMMNSTPSMGQSFPNPFGAPTAVPSNLFAGSAPAPLPTQTASGFSTPAAGKAANSFADFSIGNVMGTLNNMGYKQNASASSKPMTAVHATSTPAPAVSSNSMNFDDLLGL
ncbi:unnamed protein product [Auanema sp. JU1783]|nr:unnamed protein product [Auanema sp. JU1783]